MRFLNTLLVLTGFTAAITGVFTMVVRDNDSGCEFPCAAGNIVDNALESSVWFCIAIALWGIAATLSWMQRRFDRLQI